MSGHPVFQVLFREALAELGEVRDPGALPDDLEQRIESGAITREQATGEMDVRRRRSRQRIDRVLDECMMPLTDEGDLG